jgi:hypothetical protein
MSLHVVKTDISSKLALGIIAATSSYARADWHTEDITKTMLAGTNLDFSNEFALMYAMCTF